MLRAAAVSPVRLKLNITGLPSASLPLAVARTETDGRGKSSLVMVPVTGPAVPTVYPLPVARVRETVSSVSRALSGVGSMLKVAVEA